MTNPVTLSATRFRIALICLLILSVLAVGGIIAYGINYLNKYAGEVNQVAVEASNTEANLIIVQQEISGLEDYKTAVERSRQIVAESQTYKYQNTIIEDIEAFARRAGVAIKSYTFDNEEQNTSSSTDSKSKSSSVKPTDKPNKGPNSKSVSIALNNPTNYRNFLQFLYYIEQNLTKMQVTSISVNKDSENKDNIESNGFVIKVYVR